MQSRKEGVGIANYDQFFYPLDMIKDWNKNLWQKWDLFNINWLFPGKKWTKGLNSDIATNSTTGDMARFLCVLKLLGDKSGLIAFPEPGYTLSLDFPVNDKVFKLVEETR